MKMKIIWLTKGQFTMVDDEDYKSLSQFNWQAYQGKSGIWYASRGSGGRNNRKYTLMHRQILGIVDDKKLGDHIDRNGLNNQRNNLRVATKSQNGANKRSVIGLTSKYLGVHFCKRVNKWEVHIRKGKYKKYLGRFEKEDEAALIYNKAAKEVHGEFANLNKI